MAVTLCVLLWAHEGQASALVAYEDQVLALIPHHGGQVIKRARTQDGSDGPLEVHLLEFPDEAALDRYMADERRAALAEVRDRAIARTEVLRVNLI